MYKVGQDNTMHICLTTSEAHIVLKELYKGMAKGHFVIDITAKNSRSRVLVANYIQ
jgi:hypothetical protein